MKRTVLITGANKGIGFETAKQLIQQGYFVYLGCRDLEKGNEAVAQLASEGLTDAQAIALDVTRNDSLLAAAQQIGEQDGRLDILINNAGIPGSMPQNASEVEIDNMRTVFETNFYGVVRTTQAFVPLLKQSGLAVVVNVSSDLGSLGNQTNPGFKHFEVKPTAYVASKAALNAYTVTLAYEFKDAGFKVNSVNPGYTKTDFNNNSGPKPVDVAAETIVKYAILDQDGPTGKFFSDYGETPW